MKCSRCSGLMVEERFYGVDQEILATMHRGWRCVICGHVVDDVILENRRASVDKAEDAGQVAFSHAHS